MRTRVRFKKVRAASVGLAAFACSSLAQAKDERAFVSLTVNRAEQGEVLIVLRDGDVLLDRKVLEAAGLRGFSATEVESAGARLISLTSVRPPLRFDLDQESVVLRVDAPIEVLPTRTIDLSAPKEDVSYARRSSAFLNYAPNATVSSFGPATGGTFFEAGVSEKNRLWYTGVNVTTTEGVTRGLSNLTFDDRRRMLKLTVGDSNISSGPIGGAAILGGVTFARDFALNPYFIRFPSRSFVATTLVPAHVDVYINGIRVKSEALDPGTFTLDNVRGLVGAGTVSYVVRDALGRQQLYQRPYYVGPSVLAQGLDDFGASLGFPRDAFGVESFAYQGPALISYYRRGMTNAITLGARAEGRLDRASGGPLVAIATPAGLFELETGASAADGDHFGAAGLLSYEYVARRFSTGASVRALTREYATASLTPQMDRSLYQASTFTAVPVARRATLSSHFSLDLHRDLPTFARVGSLFQVQLASEITVIFEADLVSTGARQSWLDSFLTLTWSPDFKFHMSAGAAVTQGTPSANVQVSKSSAFGEDWGLTTAANVSKLGTQVSANHQIRTSANVTSTYLDWSTEGASLSLQPAGAIVWVEDAGLFLTRPVYDSFALVRVPKVKDVRVYLNAQEVGRTNRDGNLLVPSMISYSGSQLRIASEDVPLNYSLDEDMIVAAPPRRGAAYVEFSATPAHYCRGRVRIDRGGAEEIPLHGDFVTDNRGAVVVSPIGDDGTFEFEGLSEGNHTAEIRYKKEACRFSFAVTESERPLVDLGTLRCIAK